MSARGCGDQCGIIVSIEQQMKIINMVRLIDKESIPAGVCLLSLHDRHLPNDTRPSSNRDGAVILISMSRRLSFHQSFRVSEIY